VTEPRIGETHDDLTENHDLDEAVLQVLDGSDEASTSSKTRMTLMFSAPAVPESKDKMAEMIAHRIELDIVHQKWPLGTVLGSEAELIKKYGVSRAVMRESIRILEHHTTARMRRGPNGGLVVTEPSVKALTTPLALYLDYLRVNPGQIFETRRIIELAAVEAAAENITEQGIRDLRAVLAHEREVTTEHPNVAADIHVRIAELSGNPVLPLFVSVLTDLVEVHLEQYYPRVKEVASSVQDAHAGIVDAISRGDVALARLRMLRHLNAISTWTPPSSG
jgi:DNA-binding FadR family transcriptional regulator